MKKTLQKSVWILFLTVVLLGVPRLSGAVADLINYHAIDPDGSYAWVSVHHIVQALIFIFIIYAINIFNPSILAGSFQPFQYPLTSTNILGQLGFQLFLSGPSEELIFRAFAITMLALVVKGRFFKGKASYANLIAAIIFGSAHVGFSFAPFALNYTLYQVILAISLGIFYGDCFEKSGSVFYPMMMHSISNIIMVSLTIIATLLL